MNGIAKSVSSPAKTLSPTAMPMSSICNVWSDNFAQEVSKIGSMIPSYPCIAFVTILSHTFRNRTQSSLDFHTALQPYDFHYEN